MHPIEERAKLVDEPEAVGDIMERSEISEMISASLVEGSQHEVEFDLSHTTAIITPQKPGLDTLPFDIIGAIFTWTTICAATCIGLTCTKLYAFFKIQYPNKIMLWQPACPCCPATPHVFHNLNGAPICQLRLSDLITMWIGPEYRFVRLPFVPVMQFLRIEMYGTKGIFNDKADLLRDRYSDFYGSRRALADGNFAFLLPSPFGLGAAWYHAALSAIVTDYSHCESSKKWQKFWKGANVFKENKSFIEFLVIDVILSFFGEFCEMVGF